MVHFFPDEPLPVALDVSSVFGFSTFFVAEPVEASRSIADGAGRQATSTVRELFIRTSCMSHSLPVISVFQGRGWNRNFARLAARNGRCLSNNLFLTVDANIDGDLAGIVDRNRPVAVRDRGAVGADEKGRDCCRISEHSKHFEPPARLVDPLVMRSSQSVRKTPRKVHPPTGVGKAGFSFCLIFRKTCRVNTGSTKPSLDPARCCGRT